MYKNELEREEAVRTLIKVGFEIAEIIPKAIWKSSMQLPRKKKKAKRKAFIKKMNRMINELKQIEPND